MGQFYSCLYVFHLFFSYLCFVFHIFCFFSPFFLMFVLCFVFPTFGLFCPFFLYCALFLCLPHLSLPPSFPRSFSSETITEAAVPYNPHYPSPSIAILPAPPPPAYPECHSLLPPVLSLLSLYPLLIPSFFSFLFRPLSSSSLLSLAFLYLLSSSHFLLILLSYPILHPIPSFSTSNLPHSLPHAMSNRYVHPSPVATPLPPPHTSPHDRL